MNKIMITGRLTEDPKVKYSDGSEPLAHAIFNFAVPDMTMKRDSQGNYPTDFFRCFAFGKKAEIVETHCKTGTKLLIVGKLKNNNYEKNEQKVYGNEIAIETIEFLETKSK